MWDGVPPHPPSCQPRPRGTLQFLFRGQGGHPRVPVTAAHTCHELGSFTLTGPAMNPPPRRVRLKPWLVAQVNSQRYPGLQWLDAERRRFAIPWRHATRHPPAPQDHDNIFKAWAQETGKFTEGVDEPDPAKWKANLRCALNKSREFRLLFDGTKATPIQPYKVYELCQGPADGADGVAEDDYGCVGEEDVSQLQKMTSLSIKDTRHGGDLLPSYPWPKEEPHFGSGCPPGPFAPPLQALLPAEVGDTHGTPELAPATLSETGPPLGTLGPPSTCPIAPMEHIIPNLLISPHMLPLTDLEIKFQYRGRQVCVLTISNPHGCRLFHSSLEPTQEQVELFGPLTLEQVRFPATDTIPNEKQRFYTHQLLDVLDRGLILELQGQDIYAIRLCQCKVFWTGPCATHSAGPNPIEREKKTKLFSLEGFLNGLILFQKGQTMTPPPFEIFLCFGEEWPDQKPKEKKLITVQVVPVAARLLLEMFSGELSWSADSIPLQISHPDLKDKMVEQFKELHQLWQNQQRLPPVQPEPRPAAAAGAWVLPPGSLPQ
ncbi:interferon regulatory factor 5 isoform X1 [Falco biarmicus]|uniref:interferon regulatory factor 5 isoform X1 n=1 Tax=Falco cherrug TaxID=345164 RepID=UPI0024798F1E|nr:interferon regulatory factor 5 isoform X1 [Falco cherrug]XP_056196048.1 interferon regulatory factor 5 isoform X1 [Falco biarmicus]